MPVSSTPLEGRVALVTGSTTGLGKAIATALGAAGAKVAINYKNDAERALLALFCGALCVLLAGCRSDTGPRRTKLGYVTNGVASFWVIAEAGAEAAALDLDVDVDVLMPAAGIADQKRMLEDLLTRGIDGIAVSPIDPVNQTELLDDVARRTHLITHDSDAPDSERLYYVGMDNYQAGRLCGELVKEALPEGGKVFLFIGRLEQDNARRRRQGVIDELLDRDYDPERHDPPGGSLEGERYTILGTLTDQFDRAKAKANAEDALSRHGDVDVMVGLFAYNPPLILEALKQARKLGEIKVVAFDEADETLRGILDGTVYGTVVQNPYEYGYRSVAILHAIVTGDPANLPSGTFVDIPARQIRRDQAEAYWNDLKAKLGKE